MTDYTDIHTIPQPHNTNKTLFPHQLASVYNMEQLERNKRVETLNGMKETKLGLHSDISGYGKCMGIDTPILMFNGTVKKIQDVAVGDLLMGDDSTKRQVKSLARGRELMYRIDQEVGDSYTVNESHILSLKHGGVVMDICVKDYIELSKQDKNSLTGYKVGVEYKEQYISINPYTLGVFFYANSTISNIKIPQNYLTNSRKNRLLLLAGFIDSCGQYLSHMYIVSSGNIILDTAIISLARSLGYKVQTTDIDIVITGNDLTEIPTRNIKCEYKTTNVDVLCTGITVTPICIDDYYGFEIDGNHRYVLGDYTVTHNTLSVATLVLRDKMDWDMDMPYAQEIINTESAGLICNRVINRYIKINATLVLIDQSIVQQWTEEIGVVNLRCKSITTKNDIKNLNLENIDIVLVVPTMYNKLVSYYTKYAWKRFIFDEPGHIRVPDMKEVIAGFYWFVTATPSSICSLHRGCRRSFIKDIIGQGLWDFDCIFEGMVVKNDSVFVKESFAMPETTHVSYECYQPVYNTINKFVSNEVLAMVEAGDIHGAINALGGTHTSNIVELIKCRKLEEISELEDELETSVDSDVSGLVTSIDNLHSQINDLHGKFEERLKGSCNICLDNIISPVLVPCCQNIFCGNCLISWLKNHDGCPICRSKIPISSLVYISTNTSHEDVQNTPIRTMTKLETISEILNSKIKRKVIIYSAYEDTFIPICNMLTDNNIKFSELYGTVIQRHRALDAYKSGENDVIFLTCKSNGAGVNLKETTDIILYHDVTKYTENHILGKALRIGRTIPLKVHHLKIKS